MHQRTQHLDIICKSCKESKFSLVDVLILFLQYRYWILLLGLYAKIMKGLNVLGRSLKIIFKKFSIYAKIRKVIFKNRCCEIVSSILSL